MVEVPELSSDDGKDEKRETDLEEDSTDEVFEEKAQESHEFVPSDILFVESNGRHNFSDVVDFGRRQSFHVDRKLGVKQEDCDVGFRHVDGAVVVDVDLFECFGAERSKVGRRREGVALLCNHRLQFHGMGGELVSGGGHLST